MCASFSVAPFITSARPSEQKKATVLVQLSTRQTSIRLHDNLSFDMEGQIPESSGNVAAWLHGVGKDLQLGPSEIHKAGPGELLIKVQAAAVQPAEWKIQRGLLPIPLSYPNILGSEFTPFTLGY
jgi:hypothetical protein